ncbi:MAG: hypothetical protein CV090_02345 [Nitrospira sp. WS238]|nr:hypothetical protein [Nitrospira sp. WS238]
MAVHETIETRPVASRMIHYTVACVVLLGALYYVWTTLPSAPTSRDPQEAEALALVQNYPAIGYSTIAQAMEDHVRTMKARGQGVRLGEWRVKHVEGDIFEIRLQLRDQGVRGQWFEREFIWHAHLQLKKVNAASLPADGVTPKAPDQDPPAGLISPDQSLH